MTKLQKFHKSYKIVDFIFYKNEQNQKHGLHQSFWKNGCLCSEYSYHKNLFIGLEKCYYTDDRYRDCVHTNKDVFNGIQIKFNLTS